MQTALGICRYTAGPLQSYCTDLNVNLNSDCDQYAPVADYSFSMYTPSIIAAASIAAALDGLEWTVKSGYSLSQLLDRLHNITAIERVSSGSTHLAMKVSVVCRGLLGFGTVSNLP